MATSPPNPERMLGIYLNDHLAGSTLGTALAARIARRHRGTATGRELDALAREIRADRASLHGAMRSIGVRVAPHKVALAWLAEKAGRLKLNGALWTPTPLSSVLELEMLALGVRGKAAGWRTLLSRAETDRRLDADRLRDLITRADHQLEALEELRIQAAARTFGGG
ncbi:hypothetical protein [Saccharopolyspora sp. CA-218241]|uniref:hypothetical protein n=1 Tax=Saccharopolyspora sp. CA-218241 TaxID=3240027 RepID=UPI003D98E81F